MEPRHATSSLHELLAEAVERAADAQEESAALIEQQREVLSAVRETLARKGRSEPTFGNGQRDAAGRCTPG